MEGSTLTLLILGKMNAIADCHYLDNNETYLLTKVAKVFLNQKYQLDWVVALEKLLIWQLIIIIIIILKEVLHQTSGGT